MTTRAAFGCAEDPERLLRGITNREPHAFEALYRGLYGYVLAIALRHLRHSHEAEDVVQDVFLALWHQPPEAGHGLASLLAWIGSVTHKQCLMRFRRSRREYPAEDVCCEPSTAPEQIFEQAVERERRQTFEFVLGNVTAADRTILSLTYRESLNPPQIARRLGMPVMTVRRHLNLAVERMRLRLAARQRAGVATREEPKSRNLSWPRPSPAVSFPLWTRAGWREPKVLPLPERQFGIARDEARSHCA